jgi:hypothetical protein
MHGDVGEEGTACAWDRGYMGYCLVVHKWRGRRAGLGPTI